MPPTQQRNLGLDMQPMAAPAAMQFAQMQQMQQMQHAPQQHPQFAQMPQQQQGGGSNIAAGMTQLGGALAQRLEKMKYDRQLKNATTTSEMPAPPPMRLAQGFNPMAVQQLLGSIG